MRFSRSRSACRPSMNSESSMNPNCSAMFGGGPGAAGGVPGWRTPITRMRSAPRWIAGASGVDWRSAPSPKCQPSMATGGNRNGIGGARHQVIEADRRRGPRAARRGPRSRSGRELSTKVTDSARVIEVALITQTESGRPAAIDCRERREVDVHAPAARAAANCRGANAASAAASRPRRARRRGAGPSAACRACRRGTPGRCGTRPRRARARPRRLPEVAPRRPRGPPR